jgi:hypothetical protein
MVLGLGLDQLRSPVDGIVRPIPVDDHAVDAAADHILDLALDLRGIVGAVTDIHMARSTKPCQQMRVNLGRGAGVKKRVDINLADISCALVPIRLIGKPIGGAGVVGGLLG